MAPTPFRRRGKLGKAARNMAIADAALALARDRMGTTSRRRRGPSGKALLLGGAVVAVAAGALWKRDKVAGLLPSHTDSPEPWTPSAPGPSNYDAPGPVANTATPVPAPEPHQPPAIDEKAEEAAAAAEAANVGGEVSGYAGPADRTATEPERPLAEAGEGEAEGQEQAERDLAQAAEPTAPGVSDTERRIDDTIEAAADPQAGEQVEPVRPAEEPASEAGAPAEEETAPDEPATAGDESATDESETTGESGSDAPSEESKDEDEGGGTDWKTWSGRSVNP
jgi:hypothetical protein